MKKILILFERNIASLPPLLTTIEILSKQYEVVVIAGEYSADIDALYKDVEFIHFYKTSPYRNKLLKGLYKLKKIFLFRKGVANYLKTNNYDILWVASAEAAVQLSNILQNRKYVLNIYELYDRKPKFQKRLKPLAQQAHSVIVPEYNRANMLHVWFQLKRTPFVIPNKPIFHPRTKSILVDKEYRNRLDHNKIILYQGAISKERNLDALCKAVSSLPDFRLLLMGKKSGYLKELMNEYPCIQHIDFVAPPKHLDITSHCYIGIVTYAYYSLNTIYCAPNKIWEYSGFSIPILSNNIPGLVYTVKNANVGCCIDMDNVGDIIQAIKQIDGNYSKYQQSAKLFFESVDLNQLYNLVLKDI